MVEILNANPDEQFTFSGEEETKTLVSELGIAGQFNHHPKGESHQSVLYFGSLSHFIEVILYAGHPDPRENGYLIRCFPRSKVSYSQFMETTKKRAA